MEAVYGRRRRKKKSKKSKSKGGLNKSGIWQSPAKILRTGRVHAPGLSAREKPMLLAGQDSPGPGKYFPDKAYESPGLFGRFSTARPKSDVDVMMYRAKSLPGPGSYDSPAMADVLPQGGVISKGEPKDEIDWIVYAKREIPSPAHYPAPKLPEPGGGGFNMSNPKGWLDWIEYRQKQLPGPRYNVSLPWDAPQYSMQKKYAVGNHQTTMPSAVGFRYNTVQVSPQGKTFKDYSAMGAQASTDHVSMPSFSFGQPPSKWRPQADALGLIKHVGGDKLRPSTSLSRRWQRTHGGGGGGRRPSRSQHGSRSGRSKSTEKFDVGGGEFDVLTEGDMSKFFGYSPLHGARSSKLRFSNTVRSSAIPVVNTRFSYNRCSSRQASRRLTRLTKRGRRAAAREERAERRRTEREAAADPFGSPGDTTYFTRGRHAPWERGAGGAGARSVEEDEESEGDEYEEPTVSSVEEEDEDQTPGPGAYDQDPITFRGEDGQFTMSKARSAPAFSFGLS